MRATCVPKTSSFPSTARVYEWGDAGVLRIRSPYNGIPSATSRSGSSKRHYEVSRGRCPVRIGGVQLETSRIATLSVIETAMPSERRPREVQHFPLGKLPVLAQVCRAPSSRAVCDPRNPSKGTGKASQSYVCSRFGPIRRRPTRLMHALESKGQAMLTSPRGPKRFGNVRCEVESHDASLSLMRCRTVAFEIEQHTTLGRLRTLPHGALA